MKLYFSTNQFPQLQQFSFAERQQIIAIAGKKITPVAKLILNLIKLAILIPPFMMLAKIDSWMFLLPVFGVIAGYFCILRPVFLSFLSKYLETSISEFNEQKSN